MTQQLLPTTLQFLKDLKDNNNREWFTENKDKFLLAKENFHEFIQALIDKMAVFDPSLKVVEAQKCIFRIYRDVRFSNDKTPYKNNFAATLKGRGNGLAGYYLQLEPGATFIAGGLYGPDASVLKAIRQEISYNGSEFLKIINHKVFKKELTLEGSRLQKVPQGFEKENPMADFLKYKDFTVFHAFNDVTVLKEDFLLECARIFKAMGPFNQFLNVPVLEVSQSK
jgi:uncharacterized protein (TIGR02453 family)